MPRVTLEKNGLKLEADLTLADIKELMGMNGSASTGTVHAASSPPRARLFPDPPKTEGGYGQFFKTISDRGREFIRALQENPNGIGANALAARLGFTSPTQIGGLSGGGLAKVANRMNVDIRKIYRTEITTPNGVRTVMFFPGELLLNEKPAA